MFCVHRKSFFDEISPSQTRQSGERQRKQGNPKKERIMIMKEIYQMTKEEVLQTQHASEDGLAESEVLKIRQEMGENCLKEAKKKSPVRIFAEQFLDRSSLF